ncbi:MAG TPA: M50 family metallopeptidase, partial [Oculatellaceae cyanobacterium]
MANFPVYELFALPGLERLGSILMMLLFISVLVIAHELGHFWVARRCGIKVERFGFGLPFGPTLWSKNIGGVEYCIHACLFGGYVSFPDDDPDNPLPKDAPERFENKPIWARFAVMIAGVTVNAILGWLIMFFVFMTWGYPTGEAENRVLVGGVTSQSAPAAKVGFKKGDELKTINNQPIAGKNYVEMAETVRSAMKRYALKPVSIGILRNGQEKVLTVTPGEDGKIGIQLAAVAKYEPVAGPLDAAGKSTTFLSDVVGKQAVALGQLFTGKTPLSELAGPIRIVNEGASMIDQNGIQTGLMLTAIISIILAVMNLLPIPALDGGHIFFLLIEAIKGSPVKQEFRERVTQAGFIGLLGLIAFILL